VAIRWVRSAIYRRCGAGNDYHAHGEREGWTGREASSYDCLLVVLGLVDGTYRDWGYGCMWAIPVEGDSVLNCEPALEVRL